MEEPEVVNLYDTLGVHETASVEDIRAAYKVIAFRYHPDINQEGDREDRHRFVAATRAFQVLRDTKRREEYDRLLRFRRATQSIHEEGRWDASFRPGSAHPSPGSQRRRPGRRPNADLDDLFEELLRRMRDSQQHRTGRPYESEAARERRHAQRMSQELAWKLEKEQAAAHKARSTRIRQRAEAARAARQAVVLRRFWQTHGGLARQDVAVAAAFLAGSVLLAFQWKAYLTPVAEASTRATAVGGAGSLSTAAASAGSVK